MSTPASGSLINIISGGTATGIGPGWAQRQEQMAENTKIPDSMEITLLGYMMKYNIPKEKYPEIYRFVCQRIGETALLKYPYSSFNTQGLLEEVCKKDLQNFYFNHELNEVLEEK